MKRLIATQMVLVGGILLMAGASSPVLWGQQEIPLMGTWKINPSETKYAVGAIPSTLVNKFELHGANGVKYTSDRVSGDGEKVRFEFTATFDGKTHPYKGNPNRDAVSLLRMDPYTYRVSYKKDGETTQINYWVVSKDGKNLTTFSSGITGDNRVYQREVVFDRQ